MFQLRCLTIVVLLTQYSSLQSQESWALKAGCYQDIWISKVSETVQTDDYIYKQSPILGYYSYRLKPPFYQNAFDPTGYALPSFQLGLESPEKHLGAKLNYRFGLAFTFPNRVHTSGLFSMTSLYFKTSNGLSLDSNHHPTGGSTTYGWCLGLSPYISFQFGEAQCQFVNRSSLTIGAVYFNRKILDRNKNYETCLQSPFGWYEWYPIAYYIGTKSIQTTDYTKDYTQGYGLQIGYNYKFGLIKHRLKMEAFMRYTHGMLPLMKAKYVVRIDGVDYSYYTENRGTSFQVGFLFRLKQFNKKDQDVNI